MLVGGRVPFDDKSVSGLHARVERGLVRCPAWLNTGKLRASAPISCTTDLQ